MVGLIKEFAHLQNVTQITACLPIPRAVGELVPWGILTSNLSSETSKNDGTHCEQVPVAEWQEQIDYVKKQWKTPGSRANCEKLLNYVFVQTVFPNVDWCAYDELMKKNVSRIIIEWKCRKSNQTTRDGFVGFSMVNGLLISISVHGQCPLVFYLGWDDFCCFPIGQ